MKTFIIAAVLSLGAVTPVSARDITSLADGLAAISGFRATAEHEILLPTEDDPMTYALGLLADTASADTLAPVSYLITWSAGRKGGSPDGFASYFTGNLYQYRDQLLREHHFSDNPQTFAPCDNPEDGLQNHVQFVNLLPQYISRTFREMAADSTYKYTVTDTVIAGQHVVAVNGTRCYRGEKAAAYTYIFDRTSLWPLRSENVSNPDTGSERVITTAYSYTDTGLIPVPQLLPTDERALAGLFPDIFSNFRESTLTPAGLKGRTFPPFSLPTVTGERYTLDKGRGFARPTIIVLIDAESPDASAAISSVRRNAAQTGDINIIMAFINNNTDLIENISGHTRPGEQMLMNARGLAHSCGASELPVIFYCDRSAKVIEATVGVNNAADDIVIQKTALIAD